MPKRNHHRNFSSLTKLITTSVAVVWLTALASCSGGGGNEVTGPAGPAPVIVSDIEILSQHATENDPNADATCQTGAVVVLRAFDPGNPAIRTHDPNGQEITCEWLDTADAGFGFQKTPDWGPDNPFVITDVNQEFTHVLSTIGLHHIQFKVRTRDGRTATETIVVRVTTCEDCG